MALSNTQAIDIMALLRWVCGLPGSTGVVPSTEDGRAVALRLAGAAYRQLSAGLLPDEVIDAWPVEVPPQPAEVAAAALRIRPDIYEAIQALHGHVGGPEDSPDDTVATTKALADDWRLVLDWVAAAPGGTST